MLSMSRAPSLLFIAGLLSAQTPEIFVGKPCLQLSDAANLAAQESMVVLWHTELATGAWSVEWHGSKSQTWRPVPAPVAQTVGAPGIPKHQVDRAKLTGLAPGEEFRCRVFKDGKPVFEAAGRARKSASHPVRFALFGDSSQNTPGQRAVACTDFRLGSAFKVAGAVRDNGFPRTGFSHADLRGLLQNRRII
jgi:hypothetical protein